jgi:hypothetical protein
LNAIKGVVATAGFGQAQVFWKSLSTLMKEFLIAFLFNISTQNTMGGLGPIGRDAEAGCQILQSFTLMRVLLYLGPTQTLSMLTATKRVAKEPAFLGKL